MTIKMNVKKVYDWLDRNFLKDTIKDLGLKNHFISLIMQSILLYSIKVVWNNELTYTFDTYERVQQGNPYLHIFLCYVLKSLLIVLK